MSPSPPGSDRCSEAQVLTPDLLGSWPLPRPAESGDKEQRGRVLIVGGSPEMPGPALLAALAALRAGAGKLRLAVPVGIAAGLALAIPEARVFALPQSASGALGKDGITLLAERANEVDAVLFGPGLVDEVRVSDVVREVLARLERPVAVLDATAMAALRDDPDCLHRLGNRAIVTPHAGEMASLCGRSKEEVQSDPPGQARAAAQRWSAVVALKGAETWIAAPQDSPATAGTSDPAQGPGPATSGDRRREARDRLYVNRAGNVGLATSGSGDTLAGIIAGLAARGADPLQAACWGVSLHGAAGDRLAERIGPLGFLARELLDEIPSLMHSLAARRGVA